jgi:uncharacterized membrane protein
MLHNRQAEKHRLAAELDYETNLKAELEIMLLHLKMDQLRDTQWQSLIPAAAHAGPDAVTFDRGQTGARLSERKSPRGRAAATGAGMALTLSARQVSSCLW